MEVVVVAAEAVVAVVVAAVAVAAVAAAGNLLTQVTQAHRLGDRHE